MLFIKESVRAFFALTARIPSNMFISYINTVHHTEDMSKTAVSDLLSKCCYDSLADVS